MDQRMRDLLVSEHRALQTLADAGIPVACSQIFAGAGRIFLESERPTYDMLPMLYAPVSGELVARDFAARPLLPAAATLPEWDQAKTLAVRFWRAAAGDARVSDGGVINRIACSLLAGRFPYNHPF